MEDMAWEYNGTNKPAGDFSIYIEEFSNWITGEANQIMNKDETAEEGENRFLHAKIYTLLSGQIRKFLNDNGMNLMELLAVWDILEDANDTVYTYQPYIDK